MSPFIVPSLKKIVGANLEKIDKVDFRYIHTDRHTYGGYLIGPSPAGGPKVKPQTNLKRTWATYSI